jgi:hypothetical protein
MDHSSIRRCSEDYLLSIHELEEFGGGCWIFQQLPQRNRVGAKSPQAYMSFILWLSRINCNPNLGVRDTESGSSLDIPPSFLDINKHLPVT